MFVKLDKYYVNVDQVDYIETINGQTKVTLESGSSLRLDDHIEVVMSAIKKAADNWSRNSQFVT